MKKKEIFKWEGDEYIWNDTKDIDLINLDCKLSEIIPAAIKGHPILSSLKKQMKGHDPQGYQHALYRMWAEYRRTEDQQEPTKGFQPGKILQEAQPINRGKFPHLFECIDYLEAYIDKYGEQHSIQFRTALLLEVLDPKTSSRILELPKTKQAEILHVILGSGLKKTKNLLSTREVALEAQNTKMLIASILGSNL